ncbi:MAG TPA: heme o synthase, partial [Candidatus Dormibacteraeota bacterium]|nr:heme o synthase [Candidatus Dormibacteraeota bacterium]
REEAEGYTHDAVNTVAESISRPTLASQLRDYVSLIKLRIVVLLVGTAFPAMIPAAHGLPRLETLIGVILGGLCASGGANAINCWFDRDIDAVMRRTRNRPIPAGRIPAWHALALGIALNVIAFAVLSLMANVLAAALALCGTLIYVFVYTIWLKRTSTQNIVIGGAAGAIPPLVGWAAVTGRLDLTALSLFLVIFFWTPPHFWALAQMLSKDYERVSVPMLPAVAGGKRKAQVQSIIYAVLALGASVVPFFTHSEGVVYLAGAGVLGIGLVALTCLDLSRNGWTRRLYGYSLLYLACIFVLLAVGVAF